jgi:hypothetical protein
MAEPRGITPTLFQPKSCKIKFSLFHPSVNQQMPVDIFPDFQGRIFETPRQSLEEFF